MPPEVKINFSPKQRSLLRQLENLVNVAQQAQLPMEVVEIVGFGSFFRGKRDAKDVDIKIEYGKEHPFYDIFDETMKHIIKMAIENNADSAYKTPIELFNVFMSTWMQNSKDASTVTQYATVSVDWLQGITWNMLFNDEYRDVLHSRNLTDRMLKRHSRNVNVSHGIGKLLTDITFVVWSRKKPDFKKNIEEIFSPNTVRQSRIRSLREFELQLIGVKLHADYLLALFKMKTEGGRYRKVTEEEIERALPIIAKIKGRGAYGERWEVSSDKDIQELGLKFNFDESGYLTHSDEVLEELVETKRKELKRMRARVEVWQTASGYQLDRLVELAEAGTRENDQIPLYLALHTLEKVPKKLVKEEEIREDLRILGLPEHKIESRRYDGGRTHYRELREGFR